MPAITDETLTMLRGLFRDQVHNLLDDPYGVADDVREIGKLIPFYRRVAADLGYHDWEALIRSLGTIYEIERLERLEREPNPAP